MRGPDIFRVEHDGSTLLIVPQRDLGSLAELELESELGGVLKAFEGSSVKHVAVDFQHVPYFGSTMVSILIRLRKLSRRRGGQMGLCNLSEPESQVLKVMKLESMWPSFTSRHECLTALSQSPPLPTA